MLKRPDEIDDIAYWPERESSAGLSPGSGVRVVQTCGKSRPHLGCVVEQPKIIAVRRQRPSQRARRPVPDVGILICAQTDERGDASGGPLADDHRHRQGLCGGPSDCGAWMAPGGDQRIKRSLIVQLTKAEDQALKLVIIRPAREPLRQFHALGFDLVSRVGHHR